MVTSRLSKSFVGSFAARSGLSLVEFVGVLFVATTAGAATLGTFSLIRAVAVVVSLATDFGTREATKKRIAERRDQSEFLAVSLLLRATLLVPVTVVLLFLRDPLTAYVGSALALPFLVAIAALDVPVRTVDAGLHGEQRVGRAETAVFANVTAKVLVWVVLLAAGYGLPGLLVGTLVGRLVQLAVGLHFLSIRPRRPDRGHVVSVLRFSRYSWLGAVRERAWIWTDTLVLGFFVAPEIVGAYELAWQLSAAFFLVASAISSTLFANVDRILDEQGRAAVRTTLEESLVYAGIAAIPGVFGAFVIGASLLSAVSTAYVVAAPALVLLVAARLAHCYGVVFEKVSSALDRPDLVFRADTAFVAINLVGNVLLVATVGWLGAAIATAAAMTVRTLLSYGYLRTLLRFSIPWREVTAESVGAFAMGVVLLVATGGHHLTPAGTAAAIVGGGAVYVLLVLAVAGRIRGRVRTAVAALV